MSQINLSIIIPCFNEEGSINSLLNELYEHFGDVQNYEVILVDDGSHTRLEEAIESSLKEEQLIILRNDFNKGQTQSIKSGLNHSRGKVIGLLDGDGQNPPSELRKLYDRFLIDEKKYDAVISFRGKRKDSSSKRITSRLANLILKFFTKSNFKDLGSSLKIIKKEAIDSIKLDGELHRFIVPMLEKRNFNIVEVATDHKHRKSGKSNYGLNRIVPVFVDGIQFYLSQGFTKTKRYALGKLSFYLIFVSFILNIYVVYQKLIQDIFVHRNPLFLSGLFAAFLGVFIFSLALLFDDKE